MVALGEIVLFVGVALFSFLFGYGYHAKKTAEPPLGPVDSFIQDRRERLRERYATGEISREQFAAEIETLESPSTERIMHLARDVDGIGPHIGFNVAREFDSVEKLAAADQADLEAINRIGENRAHAVLQRARQECET